MPREEGHGEPSEHGRERAANLIGRRRRHGDEQTPPWAHGSSDAQRLAPPTVAHAIVRSAVLDRLEGRWDHPVTTVVAGAGFGKSVLLGQAMRANRARPRGVEGYVTAGPTARAPERLAASVEAAFGAPDGGRGTPLDRLYAVFADQAPLDVSLRPRRPRAAGRRAGRGCSTSCCDGRRRTSTSCCAVGGCPALGLARFRAADDLVEVGADDLRFDAAEVAALAAEPRRGAVGADLAGWPALVRLALVAPLRSVDEFLWEEVMRSLGADDRAALLALCLLGPSGVRGRRGRDRAARSTPMASATGCRWSTGPASCWWPTTCGPPTSTTSAPATESRRRRSSGCVDAVAARGDPIATGSMAVRLGDAHALRRAAVDLVRATLGSLPVDVAESWATALRRPGRRAADGPIEAELLDCALANARSAAAPPADRLDRLADAFPRARRRGGRGRRPRLATLASEARDDVAHLVGLAAAGPHARRGPGRAAPPAAGRPASTRPDGRRAAATSTPPSPSSGSRSAAASPGHRPEAMVRLHWHFLILAGRAGDAAELTADLDPVPGLAGPRAARRRPLARRASRRGWSSGGVDIGPGPVPTPERAGHGSTRPRSSRCSPPRPPTRDRCAGPSTVLDASPFAAASGPDGAFTAVARACGAVVDHDDAAAAAIIARFVDAGTRLDPLTDAHLRRSLAVPYVCSPELRRQVGRGRPRPVATAGPCRRPAAARRRAQAPCPRPRATAALDAMCTALPLPWSVELAARAAAAEAPWGAGPGRPPHRPVRRRGDRRDHPATRRPRRTGPTRCRRRAPGDARTAARHRGDPGARPAGGRSRRATGGRARAAPDPGAGVAERPRGGAHRHPRPGRSTSCGPTSTRPGAGPTCGSPCGHLQRVLEPGRGQGVGALLPAGRRPAAPARRASPASTSTLGRSRTSSPGAEAARRRGDAGGRIEHLRAAVARWRGGRPLADLERVGRARPRRAALRSPAGRRGADPG